MPYTGVSYFDSWDIIKHCGTPNVANFGGITSDCQYWVTGYDKYYEGMQNRLYDFYQIKVNTPEGLITAKHWLHNHLSGSVTGGVANCYGSYGWPVALPPGTPLAGKPVIIYSYYPADHAVTLVGYNDSIRYDNNGDGQYTNHIDITGDGQVDMKDWEIGGFLFANSHGLSYPENGYCYIQYRVFALDYDKGGIWNHAIHIMKAKQENIPQLTMKAQIKHTSRYKIGIMAGITGDINSNEPEYTLDFPVFNFQGGDHYMQGGNELEEKKTIEVGFDITPLLSYLESGNDYRIFLLVNEVDAENSAEGEIISYSVMDYTNGVEEVICTESNVPIQQNSTTSLSVVKQLNFSKPQVDTDTIPKANLHEPYQYNLSATGGTSPYRYSLKKNYITESIQGSYPPVPFEPVVLNEFGFQELDLGFQFPFFGKTYDKISVFEDGFITFTDDLYPWPYVLPHLNFFQSIPNISLFNCRPMYFYPEKNDGIRFFTDDYSATIVYQGTVYGSPWSTEIKVAARLFRTGRIELYYGDSQIPNYVSWISGISEGTGNDFFLSEFSGSHPVPYALMQSFTPVIYPENLTVTPEGLISGTIEKECVTSLLISVTDDHNISNTKELFFTTDGIFLQPVVYSGEDERINAGDVVTISLELTNLGDTTIHEVMVNASMTDSFVEMIDNTESFGTVTAGQNILISNALSFSVDSLAPNNHMITLSVVITGSFGTRELTWQYDVAAPELCLKSYSVTEPDDGWLDPEEQGELIINLNNCGAYAVTNVWVELTTLSEFINIDNPEQYFGNLPSGAQLEKPFVIQVNEDVPYKHTAKFMVTMWGDGSNVYADSFEIPVNRLPVLILRLGTNSVSAEAMKTTLDQLSVGNEIISTSVPENMAWYRSVFISLGHYYANHYITDEESYFLENYLNSGGKIYMEGITTWHNDPQKPIHSKFNINKITTSWYPLDSLIGQPGSILQNIRLDYVAANATANYYLDAIPPAQVMATDDSQSGFGMGVSYDQGIWKTIGMMTEFGSMIDNDAFNKRDLMTAYMNFFDLEVNPVSVDEKNNPEIRAQLIPNPARKHSELIIDMPQPDLLEVQIADINGRSMLRSPFRLRADKGINRIYLDFEKLFGFGFRDGMYILKFQGRYISGSARLIINNPQ